MGVGCPCPSVDDSDLEGTCSTKNGIINVVYILHKMWNQKTSLFGKACKRNQNETTYLKDCQYNHKLFFFHKNTSLILC